jgi:hypothetical protein
MSVEWSIAEHAARICEREGAALGARARTIDDAHAHAAVRSLRAGSSDASRLTVGAKELIGDETQVE